METFRVSVDSVVMGSIQNLTVPVALWSSPSTAATVRIVLQNILSSWDGPGDSRIITENMSNSLSPQVGEEGADEDAHEGVLQESHIMERVGGVQQTGNSRDQI